MCTCEYEDYKLQFSKFHFNNVIYNAKHLFSFLLIKLHSKYNSYECVLNMLINFVRFLNLFSEEDGIDSSIQEDNGIQYQFKVYERMSTERKQTSDI